MADRTGCVRSREGDQGGYWTREGGTLPDISLKTKFLKNKRLFEPLRQKKAVQLLLKYHITICKYILNTLRRVL